MTSTADPHQLLHSLLVLQNEAMKGLTREFYQHVEAYIAIAGEHPLTQEPLAAAHSNAVALRAGTSAFGSARLVSDAVARLTRDTCDSHACVRGPVQLTDFLKRVAETIKTEDDRVQVLFVLDCTLQRARTQRKSSSSSNAEAGRALISHFDQSMGYTMLVDWFFEVCSFADDARRRLAQLLLHVLLRNKPALRGARKHVLTSLRRSLPVVSGRASKTLTTQVIEKYKDAP